MAEQGILNPLEPGLGLMPNSPTTDQMGNQTPAGMVSAQQPGSVSAGANTLANPSGSPEDSGGLPLAPAPVPGGTTLGQVMSSPHIQKMGANTQKALKANPQLAAQPGGWAKALVGGAIDALGGALGDAAAAGQPAPGGGGALTGIARTKWSRCASP